MGEEGMRKPDRVVLVPCPFQGHISPMLELGMALHSKGFSISVAHTEYNSPNPSNHPSFTFSPLYDGVTDTLIAMGDLLDFTYTFNKNFQTPFQEWLVKLMDQEKVACVIYDALMYVVDDVTQHLKLPCIIFHTCSSASNVAFSSLDRLKEEGYIPLDETKLQEPVPGVDPLRMRDLPMVKFLTLEAQLEITAIYCNIGRATSVIWNSIDCLEYLILSELKNKHQIPFFSVGPLFKMAPASSSSLLKADENCISWLNKQEPNSVLYISLGSLVSIDEKELAEMAWGLASCGLPFLWVIRAGSVHGSQWIELLPKGFEELVSERGLIVKWAPQKEVLAHESVGGFWTHCGWNSTLESIYEGVPMICSPGFGDQNVNARYISHVWKVGLELEGEPEREKVKEVVKRLMTDEEGKDVRKRATDLKEKVKLATLEGGSSYNSLNDLTKYILS